MWRKINISVIVLLVIIILNVPIQKNDLTMSYLIQSSDKSSPYNGEVLQITGKSYRFITGRYHLKGMAALGDYEWELQDYNKTGNIRVMSFTRWEYWQSMKGDMEVHHASQSRGSLHFHKYMDEIIVFFTLGDIGGKSYSYTATPLN